MKDDMEPDRQDEEKSQCTSYRDEEHPGSDICVDANAAPHLKESSGESAADSSAENAVESSVESSVESAAESSSDPFIARPSESQTESQTESRTERATAANDSLARNIPVLQAIEFEIAIKKRKNNPGQLFRADFWKTTLDIVVSFWSQSRKPAILMASGYVLHTVMIVFLIVVMGGEKTINGFGELVLLLGSCFLVTLVCGLGSLALFLWSMALWLIRLSGLSIFCLSDDFTDWYRQRYFEVHSETKPRADIFQNYVHAALTLKKELVLSWLVYSLIALIPAVWLIIGLAILYLNFSDVSGLPSLGNTYPNMQVPFELSNEMSIAIIASTVSCFFLVSNYTLLMFPFSVMSGISPGVAACKALFSSFRLFPVVSMVSFLVCVPGTFLHQAFDFLLLLPAVKDNAFSACSISLFSSIWKGLSSALLFPLAVAISCFLLKHPDFSQDRDRIIGDIV